MSYDILIKNGKIIDGAGNPWYHADIAIKDSKIIKIKQKLDEVANKVIDATGLIVCPGFIDLHSHTDIILPFLSRVESFIRQGITTCVVGMCGDSLAPIPPEKVEDAKKILSTVNPVFANLNISWNTFAQYLKKMEKVRCPLNLVFFVGYNNIRLAGGAGFENRLPTNAELESMKEYLTEAMKAGAFGMSTGLIYAPQVYVKTEELIELAKVVANHGGYYFSHIRGEGKTLINAVKEFIEIVEKSGCDGGQIAHHKVSGKIYWGASKESLRLIEEANSRGINITCDQYPYNRGMTSLTTVLPPWVHEGGIDKLLERLQNSNDRERIKKETGTKEGWENFIHENGFECIYISTVNTKKWKDIEGKNIAEITKIKGKKDGWETIFEILIDEKGGGMITIESMSEEDIRRIMTSRYQMVGTDGIGVPANPAFGKFHPRLFGTYSRILGKYVREEKVLTLEDAIRKMTSFPAQRLGLKDRGLLREGLWADIVVFDPNTVIDKATYENPHQFPEGIPHIIVNGIIVVENNKQNRKYPGKVLRRPT
ncbi:MAG: amidohydrolase family protein [Candidatus Hodarchaeota archaeon]